LDSYLQERKSLLRGGGKYAEQCRVNLSPSLRAVAGRNLSLKDGGSNLSLSQIVRGVYFFVVQERQHCLTMLSHSFGQSQVVGFDNFFSQEVIHKMVYYAPRPLVNLARKLGLRVLEIDRHS